MTFVLLFNDLKRVDYFAVMVTGMPFLKFFFYDLNYLNSTKKRLSNQKSGMVDSIFKNRYCH